MNRNNKKMFIRAISFLSVACVVLTVSTVVYANRAQKYKFATQIVYERALAELCESLDNITVSLQKGTYCSTGRMLSEIGNDLNRQATSAKVSLSQLTDKTVPSDEMYTFLSQIGAFTLSVAQNKDRLSLSEKQKKSLASLYEYSQSLSENLNKIRDGAYKGDITQFENKNTLSDASAEYRKSFLQSMSDAEQSLADYPTLIYDGPFADSMLNKKGGESLKNLGEITQDEARKIASEYIKTTPESLREEADVNSEIELYCFTKGDVAVAVTKRGGKLCYMRNPRKVGSETISTSEGIKRAKKFLKDSGYENMKDSYYSLYDGVCTINFAYTKEGAIHYSDLIKVGVALDSGEIVFADARGYLVNHCERTFGEEKISLPQAREIVRDDLKILSENSAVIPLDTGKEANCFEFRCKDKKGQEVLIYIDKETGEERDILLLLYADGGILTR